ncbi:DUF4123 domain-containing protein [Aquabacterium sp.]|uniref:DUF4123 domain-containing protein n=1 Tax=Aquabacterium sp. TaxID=1872578 RepID=UPI003783BCF1
MLRATFRDAVAASLSEALAEGHGRYLLVDAAALDGAGLGTALPLQGEVVDLLALAPLKDWRDTAAPLLFPLQTGRWSAGALAAWRSVADRWRHANALTYIESVLDQHAMAAALASRQRAMLTGGMPVLLRYFDNRVFSVLMQVLVAEQRAELLAPGHCWVHADRSGRACVHAAERPCVDQAQRLTMTAEQEAALIKAAEADAVIDQLLNQRHPQLLALLPPDQHEAVSLALEAATAHGLAGNPEQVAFSSLALALGAGFDQQAPWATLLADAKAGRQPFLKGLARMVTEGTS